MFVFLPGHFSSISISRGLHTHFQSLGITPAFVPLLYLSREFHTHFQYLAQINTARYMWAVFILAKWIAGGFPKDWKWV